MRLRQFALSGVLLLVLRTMTGSIHAMPQQDPAAAAVTFNKQVLPILQKNCQACHRPGEIAPMSFLTYRDVRPWAKAIKAAVVKRQMPPWFADPAYGHFANDKRLTDAEIGRSVRGRTAALWKVMRMTSRLRSPFMTAGMSSPT